MQKYEIRRQIRHWSFWSGFIAENNHLVQEIIFSHHGPVFAECPYHIFENNREKSFGGQFSIGSDPAAVGDAQNGDKKEEGCRFGFSFADRATFYGKNFPSETQMYCLCEKKTTQRNRLYVQTVPSTIMCSALFWDLSYRKKLLVFFNYLRIFRSLNLYPFFYPDIKT